MKYYTVIHLLNRNDVKAVELTKQFSDDDHYKFINGVLSNIKK